MAKWLSEELGGAGVYETLKALEKDTRPELELSEVVELMADLGVEDPVPTIANLNGLGVLSSSAGGVGLTTSGLRAALLLQALNGGDISEVFRKLRNLDGSLANYTLLREGMTTGFFKSLAHNPDIGALYVCSPWINLTEHERRYLATAVLRRKRKGREPNIYVVTRPEEANGTRTTNLEPFADLGAKIFLHRKLHAKLYIREPDAAGGYTLAIVGSQNLTRSKFIELGIQIESDTTIINKLIRYFFNITHYSEEFS